MQGNLLAVLLYLYNTCGAKRVVAMNKAVTFSNKHSDRIDALLNEAFFHIVDRMLVEAE